MSNCSPNQISNAFDGIQNNLIAGITNSVGAEVLPPNFQDNMNTLTLHTFSPERLQEYRTETDLYNWKRIYSPATTAVRPETTSGTSSSERTENFNNIFSGNIIEGNQNQESNLLIAKGLRDACDARMNTFRNSPNFRQFCIENADRTWNALEGILRQDLEFPKTNFNSLLKSYKALFNYKKNSSSIINKKLKELEKIEKKIDTYKQNLYIDGRKDKYENENYDFYKSLNFYVLIFYYSLLVCYFIFTPFFGEKKYKSMILITLILLYIILPFILPYILSLIYDLYIYILEYNNLKGEIISYPYIIEDREKYE